MPALQLKIWRICSVCTAILECLKRILFWRRNSRKKDDLPYTTSTEISTNSQHISSEVALEDWNEWGADDPISIKIEPSGPKSQALDTPAEDEREAEVDFFNDMTPQFKKTKILRKKPAYTTHVNPSSSSNKFSMEAVPLSNSGELGSWEESSGAWEEDASEDISLEAEAAMKEKRRLDRERRVAEHQRLKEERLAHGPKRDSKLAAVKLS